LKKYISHFPEFSGIFEQKLNHSISELHFCILTFVDSSAALIHADVPWSPFALLHQASLIRNIC